VQSNLAKTAPAAGATQGGGTKSDETLNYEVSRSTARIIEPVGSLSKVSVAILVDGKYDLVPGAKPDAKPKYQPRSPDELQKIEALVKSAVGFNAERGDQVTVANIPFQETGEGAPEAAKWWEAPILQGLLKNGLIALGFLALLLFVIRPLLKILKSEKAVGDNYLTLPTDHEAALMIETARREQEKMKLTQIELIEKVKQDPYQVAQILQNWLVHKD
jgi:flagellar M-ring protein FliF